MPSHPCTERSSIESMARQEKPRLSKEIKMMILTADTQNVLEHIISSYETRIQSVEALFETTGRILQDFHDSVEDTRQERQKINEQLRENLAKNECLRKKDFDGMISVISSQQDQQEQEVRDLSKTYFNEQQNFVRQIRKSLRDFTTALASGEAERVREFQALTRDILAEQERRKKEVIARLEEFEKEQQETRKILKNLLARGRDLRIKDFKLMLAEFKKQRQQRLIRRKEREQEVQNLLGGFKKERSELSLSRWPEYGKT